jgi:D-alanine--poly(phosphoribitol) ligase subunit 1
VTGSGADAIEVFLQTNEYDVSTLLTNLKAKLPPYMIPRKIRLLSKFPLNVNGKYDRGALLEKLKEMDGV